MMSGAPHAVIEQYCNDAPVRAAMRADACGSACCCDQRASMLQRRSMARG